MDRTEKLQYEKSVEQYFDDHKVYDLFQKLFKELIINKPSNPVDYLIERLGRKQTKRIFITGYAGKTRKEISLALAGSLGYKCLNMEDLIQREMEKKTENFSALEKNINENTLIDDSIAIELVRNQILSFEENNESYIVDGFPKNLAQSIFLQQVGLLPDNVIVLKTSREKEEQRIYEKLRAKYPKSEDKKTEEKEEVSNESHINEESTKTDEQIKAMAKHSIEEAELNVQTVQNVFAGFCCNLEIDQFSGSKEVVEELAKLLKYKDKTSAARRAPRIVLVAPPCAGKLKIVEKIAKQLQIIPIDVMDLLRKEIGKRNENSRHILDALKRHEMVPDKYVLKIIEDRLYRSDCMINGWILTGFPKNQSQINFMENMKPEIKPNKIAVIDMDEKIIYEKAARILHDPRTGMILNMNGKKYGKLPKEVVARLIQREQDQKEELKRRIDEWKLVNDILLKKNYCLRLNGEEKKKRLAQLIINAVDYDS